MISNTDDLIKYNAEIVNKTFEMKKKYHVSQARLPIEEKLKILVELQKIVLTIRPKIDDNDKRFVWQL